MRPHNMALADHLEAIAYYEELYEIENFEYRSTAYLAAASLFRRVSYDVLTEFEARQFKGVGAKISKRVQQFALTGTSRKLEKLRQEDPVRDATVTDLIRNKEISIVRANELYEAGARNLANIADYVDMLSPSQVLYVANFERFSEVIPRDEIIAFTTRVQELLEPLAMRVITVGAYRRGEPATEIDLLVVHSSETDLKIVSVLRRLTPLIIDTLSSPEATDSFRGMNRKNRVVNIRLFKEAAYPCCLTHMTGSIPFVTNLRLDAEEIGLHLNEYRLNDSVPIALVGELDLFRALDRDYVRPTLRM